jgi:hypothetical protein
MQCTIEEVGNPDVYTDLFGELVCDNPRIRQGETEDISEENDCLGLLCGIWRRWGKVVGADHGALGLTGEDETLVAIWATHGQGYLGVKLRKTLSWLNIWARTPS